MKKYAGKFGLFVVLSLVIVVVIWAKVGYELTRAYEYSSESFDLLLEDGNKIETSRPTILITGSMARHKLINENGIVRESEEVYPGYYGVLVIAPGKWEIDGPGSYDKVQVKVLNGSGSTVKVGKNFYELIGGMLVSAVIPLIWIITMLLISAVRSDRGY